VYSKADQLSELYKNRKIFRPLLLSSKQSFALYLIKSVIGFDFAVGICLNLSMPIKKLADKKTKNIRKTSNHGRNKTPVIGRKGGASRGHSGKNRKKQNKQ
jgi:hypothetical protein